MIGNRRRLLFGDKPFENGLHDECAVLVVQANLYLQQGTSFLVQGFENLVFPCIQECSIRIDGSEGRFPVFYRYFPDDRDDIRQLVELPEQEMAARRLRQCERAPA